MATATKKLKKKLLRNNEYYGIQEVFDDLYRLSTNGKIFNDLLSLIVSEQNIMLAYRNIKRNKGSSTAGTDGHAISHIVLNGILSDGSRVKLNLAITGGIQYQWQGLRRHECPIDIGFACD